MVLARWMLQSSSIVVIYEVHCFGTIVYARTCVRDSGGFAENLITQDLYIDDTLMPSLAHPDSLLGGGGQSPFLPLPYLPLPFPLPPPPLRSRPLKL